ncbi:MAG: ATP-binding protein [Gammaproteobacteria bacterium]|nr:ATP-binding protein [Gammaproteobacteria bacterium]MXX28433.1 ATP-binding protein [Gammaproteobacteria bacterium]MXY05982.1 ATP-binding protein [Gammaproteobacteria bacterium]MYE52686.1 ATP-binding protein [Gammaproteobacteria bacterium]MYE86293.1 ATP-binding protein [Gammaproteobacteria bacterium]
MGEQGRMVVHLPPDLSAALSVLAQAVERFAVAESLSGGVSGKLNLVLDELITNSISYGLQGVAEPHLALRLASAEGRDVLEAVLEDNGPAFDPFSEAPVPDTTLELDERPIGGLGVMFVKQFTESAGYERIDGLNRITLRIKAGD